MLDVHAPDHKLDGARDFFMHLFTITIGLLIALALENAAEALHHRHLRKEAEANITQELRENRETLNQAAKPVLEERQSLLTLLTALEATAAGSKDAMAKAGETVFGEAPIPDAAWQTASNTGVLAYMDYEEVERFSTAYKQQNMLQAAEEKALEDYLEFGPLLQLHGKTLTSAQATQLLPMVLKALGHVNGMLAIGRGTLGTYKTALGD